MALGAQSVFVGSGIFLSEKPLQRANAIVMATSFWQEPKKLAEASYGFTVRISQDTLEVNATSGMRSNEP